MLTGEQLLIRKTGLGGSDAAAIVGLSPYATPLDIYRDKTSERVKQTTEPMQRGHALEPFVKSLFELKTGWRVEERSTTQRHGDYPFMLAHLDGVLPSEQALVEFKTALYTSKTFEEWGQPGTDEIPKHYLIQVAHYASVMNVETVYLGVLFGDDKLFKAYQSLYALALETGKPLSAHELENLRCDLRVYVYKRHADLTRKLIQKERAFWFDHVQKNQPPAPQAGCVEDLLQAYPTATSRSVILSEAEIIKVQRLAAIKQQLKELEQQEQVAKAEVLGLFGEASLLVDGSQTPLASWKNKTMTRFDKTRLAQQYPELWSLFSQTTTTRELRLM